MKLGRSVKKCLKNILSKIKGEDISCLPDSLLDQVDIISFDVFDTLILRDVKNPTDVFDLVETEFNNESEEGKIDSFKMHRIDAERQARIKCGKKDVTFDEIYQELTGVYSESVLVRLRQIEIEKELFVCKANPAMMDFYQRMIKTGKRIIIISDMYLSANTIGRILNNCGYDGYEKLYVSSEYRCMKRYEELFEVVKNDCAEGNGKRILHIGDHPIADDKMAKKAGYRSFLYRRGK